MYDFEEGRAGAVLVAEPPRGVPLAAVLARLVSRRLGSPVPLPLDALLDAAPTSLPALRAALQLHPPATSSGASRALPFLFEGGQGLKMFQGLEECSSRFRISMVQAQAWLA